MPYKLIFVTTGRLLRCFICAKAKRQLQSAQSERKSTTRYCDE